MVDTDALALLAGGVAVAEATGVTNLTGGSGQEQPPVPIGGGGGTPTVLPIEMGGNADPMQPVVQQVPVPTAALSGSATGTGADLGGGAFEPRNLVPADADMGGSMSPVTTVQKETNKTVKHAGGGVRHALSELGTGAAVGGAAGGAVGLATPIPLVDEALFAGVGALGGAAAEMSGLTDFSGDRKETNKIDNGAPVQQATVSSAAVTPDEGLSDLGTPTRERVEFADPWEREDKAIQSKEVDKKKGKITQEEVTVQPGEVVGV